MYEDLDFSSLETIELPVKYGGKTYMLREASAETSIAFRRQQAKDAQRKDDKILFDVGNVAESESLLISLCLWDDKDRQVPWATVKNWPEKVVKKLFGKAKEISELGEEETTESLQKQIAELQDKLDKLHEENPTTRGQGTTPEP